MLGAGHFLEDEASLQTGNTRAMSIVVTMGLASLVPVNPAQLLPLPALVAQSLAHALVAFGAFYARMQRNETNALVALFALALPVLASHWVLALIYAGGTIATHVTDLSKTLDYKRGDYVPDSDVEAPVVDERRPALIRITAIPADDVPFDVSGFNYIHN